MEFKKYTPEELKVDKIYDDEYFIPCKSYKTDFDYKLEERYLISNYARIYKKSINRISKQKFYPGNYMMSFSTLVTADTLSIPKLMVYNFDFNNYNTRRNYYVIDHSKPITIDNIADYDVRRTKVLTEDQKKLINKPMTVNSLEKLIKTYELPHNATRSYYRSKFGRHIRDKKNNIDDKVIYTKEVDYSKSKIFQNSLDSITQSDLSEKSMSSIIRSICNNIGISYNKNIYSKARKYLIGELNIIRIYKESSTTSQKT